MKPRVRALSLVVRATAALLTVAAVLLVVGIFDASLQWDIFGPRVEAILQGIFGSCVALAAVGVALTLVLGTQDIVRSFRALEARAGSPAPPEAPARRYGEVVLYGLLAMGILITALALVNHRVQRHRDAAFGGLVDEQMAHFEPKIAAVLDGMNEPPRSRVPRDLHDLMRTLDDLTFVSRATLYIPDPRDEAAMWGYTAWRGYEEKDGFARFYVAKDFEKAMRRAVDGDDAALAEARRMEPFVTYRLVTGADGRRLGVLRVDGDRTENFRQYRLGS